MVSRREAGRRLRRPRGDDAGGRAGLRGGRDGGRARPRDPKAGCDVLAEKPAVVDLATLDELVAYGRSHGQ